MERNVETLIDFLEGGITDDDAKRMVELYEECDKLSVILDELDVLEGQTGAFWCEQHSCWEDSAF